MSADIFLELNLTEFQETHIRTAMELIYQMIDSATGLK